jgi:hypothetical protein
MDTANEYPRHLAGQAGRCSVRAELVAQRTNGDTVVVSPTQAGLQVARSVARSCQRQVADNVAPVLEAGGAIDPVFALSSLALP